MTVVAEQPAGVVVERACLGLRSGLGYHHSHPSPNGVVVERGLGLGYPHSSPRPNGVVVERTVQGAGGAAQAAREHGAEHRHKHLVRVRVRVRVRVAIRVKVAIRVRATMRVRVEVRAPPQAPPRAASTGVAARRWRFAAWPLAARWLGLGLGFGLASS